MKTNSKYLYELLPAYYRQLDGEQGEPLKALMEVLAREAGIVEEDINRLYENWFIETCDEWVAPYIGDLLGVRGVHEIDAAAVYSQRAYVANTLGYRRRKGTAPVLEQLAQDITGWRSKVVEFFQLLATTQHLNHIRLHSKATPGLRNMEQLDLLNTPFDSLSHTVEVRRIAPGLGKYNIPNIGLYLWRLQAYRLAQADARKTDSAPEGCYTFSPLGLDSQLFNQPKTEQEIVHLAEEIHVPGPLRRRALYDELEARRFADVNEISPAYTFFDDRRGAEPVFRLSVDGTTVPPEQITICNLSEWRLPPETKPYERLGRDSLGLTEDRPIRAAVDPVLGRIAIRDSEPETHVSVNYNYGFSADVGGGPYDRKAALAALQSQEIDWQVGVSKDHEPIHGETIYETLWGAIEEWNRLGEEKAGLITIMDNRTYAEELTGGHKIEIPEGKQLYIIAADWPDVSLPDGGPEEKYRAPGTFNPENLRPHLQGNIEVQGTAPGDSSDGGELVLNGLLVEGNMKVKAGNLGNCVLSHCTLVPEKGGLEVAAQSGIIKITLERSISGPMSVISEDAGVHILECIIDHKEGTAVEAEKSHLNIQKSTLFGSISAHSLEAGNSIFNDPLEITRRQIGCVRFSYLPQGSNTPRRFRCQPELEIKSQMKEKEEELRRNLTATEKEAIKSKVLSWLFPVFNATLYGHHAYCQLGQATPRQVTAGAGNASEMGVFNHLLQAQRETNLRIALEEYLRLGLEAGILFVT